jgi:hypothetical protein
MLRKFFIYLILILIVFAGCKKKGSVVHGPKLLVVEDTFDFGEIEQTKNYIKHEFVLKNVGKKTLIINDIHPTCGCTVVDNRVIKIRPNKTETLKIKVKFNELQKGKQFKTIILTSNDSVNTSSRLIIKGTIL